MTTCRTGSPANCTRGAVDAVADAKAAMQDAAQLRHANDSKTAALLVTIRFDENKVEQVYTLSQSRVVTYECRLQALSYH